MKATLGDIYLCRTANMSWRTCVVVKQIQSNPTKGHRCPGETSDNTNQPLKRNPFFQQNGILDLNDFFFCLAQQPLCEIQSIMYVWYIIMNYEGWVLLLTMLSDSLHTFLYFGLYIHKYSNTTHAEAKIHKHACFRCVYLRIFKGMLYSNINFDLSLRWK